MLAIVGGRYVAWLFSESPVIAEKLVLTSGGTVKVVTSHLYGKPFAYVVPVGRDGIGPWIEVEALAKQADVRGIVSFTFGGSLDESFGIGNFVLPDQYIDSFGCLDTPLEDLGPVDMSFPFCVNLATDSTPIIEENEPLLIDDGTVVSTKDHFTPTRAERHFFKSGGAQLISPRIAGYSKACAYRRVCYQAVVYLAYDANKAVSQKQWDVVKGINEDANTRIFDLLSGLVRDFPDGYWCVQHVRQGAGTTQASPDGPSGVRIVSSDGS